MLVETRKVEEWVERNPYVKKWLSRLASSTQVEYMRVAYRYFKWVKEKGGEYASLSPQDMVDLQDKTVGRDRYKQVDLLEEWIGEVEGAYSTKKVLFHIVRSFYAHNRVPLPEDKRFRPKADRPPVRRELTVEDLKKLVLSSNTTYQAIFLCMFQAAMGAKEFNWFNRNAWPDIKPQLEEGKKMLRIELPGRKHARWERPYYTFLGKDAIEALKRYLKKRGSIKKGEPIFINIKKTPITPECIWRYFKRHATKVGLIEDKTPDCPECGGETLKTRNKEVYRETGHIVQYVCRKCEHKFYPNEEIRREQAKARYRCSPHEVRDLFRSEWETTPAKGIVAEFLLGHRIDENNYNKFYEINENWVQEQYRLAQPYLNIMSMDPRTVGLSKFQQLEEKIEELREKNLELKSRLNGVKSPEDLVEEVIKRLEAREKAVEKQH